MIEVPARGRRLSAEEIELWLTAMRGVARRPGSALPEFAPCRTGKASRKPAVPAAQRAP